MAWYTTLVRSFRALSLLAPSLALDPNTPEKMLTMDVAMLS